MVVGRGEVWWGEAPDEKGRPFLVVSRDAANETMRRVLVAPVTRRVRGHAERAGVGRRRGPAGESVASFDTIRPFPKVMLVRRLGSLGPRQHEICRVAGAALDC